jgi:hypothetical protein
MIECLLCKTKALSSNSSPTAKKKKNKTMQQPYFSPTPNLKHLIYLKQNIWHNSALVFVVILLLMSISAF